jgi:hypothetical protein
VTGLDHYVAAERSAAANLARTLRVVASHMLAEADWLELGEQKTVHSIRSDVHDLENSITAYEKDVAALAAARVMADA